MSALRVLRSRGPLPARAPLANIGRREIRKRRLLGTVSVAAAALLAFALIASDAPRWARLAVFLPVWMAGLGLSEAREKT